jgi:putative FmdB family regulatory protein
MPTYQYRCEKCGKMFERTETMSEHEAAKPQCPNCGSKKVVRCTWSCLRGDIQEELNNAPVHGHVSNDGLLAPTYAR